MNRYVTVGLAVLGGAALIEAALIPGVLLGAAAVLAPQALPKLRRRRPPKANVTVRPQPVPPAPLAPQPDADTRITGPGGFRIGRSLAKTITFRVIVTTLDFTSNYVVLGEFALAAGLSAFALAVAPFFYFCHEAAWNYFGAGRDVDIPVRLPLLSGDDTPAAERGRFTISQPVAKTITFRSIATVMDFTATFVVVGDLATAAGLTAFGFVVGPFVYLGHEMAWDRYSPTKGRTQDAPAPPLLLPAPA